MNDSPAPQPIVVGIDGSKAALQAALWAVDEALSRDAPLRLLCALEGEHPAQQAKATGETAIRHATAAIAAVGKPAKIETAVTAEPAIGALIRASASAAMVCVGAVGLRHFQPGRVGSTAAAVAASARCPVAIIRARRDADGRTEDAEHIVVDVDGSPDNGVLLGAAVEEARVRKAALRAIIFRRPGPGGEATDTDGTGRALADLDRRLARWKRRHPDLRVESVAVTGGLLEYLACHRDSVRLLVLGAHNHKHVSELVGPAGSAILRDTDCSLLVVDQRHL